MALAGNTWLETHLQHDNMAQPTWHILLVLNPGHVPLAAPSPLPRASPPPLDMGIREYATPYLEHYGYQLQGWVPVGLQGPSAWQGPGLVGQKVSALPPSSPMLKRNQIKSNQIKSSNQMSALAVLPQQLHGQQVMPCAQF
jgi:hypothetical protein